MGNLAGQAQHPFREGSSLEDFARLRDYKATYGMKESLCLLSES